MQAEGSRGTADDQAGKRSSQTQRQMHINHSMTSCTHPVCCASVAAGICSGGGQQQGWSQWGRSLAVPRHVAGQLTAGRRTGQ